MNNFKSSGPGGQRKRPEFIGGRPKSDANYGVKKNFGSKSFGGDRGGFRTKRSGFGAGRDNERREVTMHKATCSNCNKPCEVPFRPDGSKPVLCSECFGKNRSDDRNGTERRERFSNDRPKRNFDSSRNEFEHNHDFVAMQRQVAALEIKVDEILTLIKGRTGELNKVAKPLSLKDEVITVVSAIKKTPRKIVAKKPSDKEVVSKKVTKKVTKKVVKK